MYVFDLRIIFCGILLLLPVVAVMGNSEMSIIYSRLSIFHHIDNRLPQIFKTSTRIKRGEKPSEVTITSNKIDVFDYGSKKLRHLLEKHRYRCICICINIEWHDRNFHLISQL